MADNNNIVGRIKNKKNILILFILIIIFLGSGVLNAQGCGPSCPVCSGTTDGSMLAQRSFFFTNIYIPDGEEESAVFNMRYGLFNWMDIGIGYGVDAKKLIWNMRVQVFKEKEDSMAPGLIVGTGSVRTGDSDQSLYFHLTKSWEFSENFALRFTGGTAVLFPDFDKVYGLAGITASIMEKYSIFVNYDGLKFHEGISWIPLDWLTVSALLVESRELAFTIGLKWDLSKNE